MISFHNVLVSVQDIPYYKICFRSVFSARQVNRPTMFAFFLIYEILSNIPLQYRRDAYYQLNGCPAHFALIIRTWLDAYYPYRSFSRNCPVAWPPRSPDLTCLDLFVLNFIKNEEYSTPMNKGDNLV